MSFLLPALLACVMTDLHAQDPGRRDADFPENVPHATRDFDEWPGIDHEAAYDTSFIFNASDTDRIKIDESATRFDADDHEGYLKEPPALRAHGFADIGELLRSPRERRVLLGIFTHPDDELLLAGGLLAAAKSAGWDVRVALLSNGADGSLGESDSASRGLMGFNAVGIRPDLTLKIVTDLRGEENREIVRRYSELLGVPIDILQVDLILGGRRIVQLGDAAGTDPRSTFIPGGILRGALERAVDSLVLAARPTLLVTHGTDGEYGNFYHRIVRAASLAALRRGGLASTCLCLGGFPEYNYHDHIRYFLDLDDSGGGTRQAKWRALKEIPTLYRPDADFRAVWKPGQAGTHGVFMKNYGYSREGYPPRYEYYSVAE